LDYPAGLTALPGRFVFSFHSLRQRKEKNSECSYSQQAMRGGVPPFAR
jgi:hypothetical protein